MQPSLESLFREFQRSGDPDAVGAVYDRTAAELLRLARHLVGGAGEAEDVLQATFLTAIERASSYDPARPLRPWLTGILTNQARDARRRRGRQPDPERISAPPPPQPDRAANADELERHVDDALAALPRSWRPVLRLRLEEGLTANEIAQRLQRSPGTVRSQIARGLARVRRALPVGLAGASWIALSRPARGLEGIRAAVLERAASTVAPLAPGGPGAPAVPTSAGPIGTPLVTSTATAIETALLSSLPGTMLVKLSFLLALVFGSGFLGWGFLRGLAPRPPAELASPRAVPAAATPSVELASMPAARAAIAAGPAPAAEPPVAAPLPPLPRASGTASLSVLVVRPETRRPAAGAHVLLDVFGSFGTPWPERRAALTDDDGWAYFDRLPEGHVYARLLRGGQEGATLAEGERRELTLTSIEGAIVRGEVVDGDGHGVPGARLWLSERWSTDRGRVVGAADAAGRFRVHGVGPDHSLGAQAPGFAPSELRFVRAEPGQEVELRLVLDRPGDHLSGLVVDGDGRPVAGVELSVGALRPEQRRRLADGGFAPPPPPRHTLSDETGRFQLDAVARGEQDLRALRWGFAPLATSVWIEPGGNEVRIEMPPEGEVRGRVLDAAGTPVVGAHVYTFPESAFGASRTYSGENAFGASRTYSGAGGVFRLRGLARGALTLVAQSQAFEDAGRARTELDLGPGEVREWNPVLTGSTRLSGTVLDEEGRPLEGWTVAALEGGRREARQRSAPTQKSGRFSIPLERAGASYTLWVQPPRGWRDFPAAIVADVRADEGPVEIRLGALWRERGTIRAEVVDAAGAPVTDAALELWHVEERLWRSFSADGTTGVFTVENVPAGTLSIELKSPTQPWQRLGTHAVEPGGTLDLGRIVCARPGFVHGTVEGIAADDLDSLRLLLIDEAGMEAGALERNGRDFRSSPLQGGSYRLLASGDFVASLSLPLQVGAGDETEVGVHLQRAGLRVVRLLPPEGATGPERVWCEARDENDQRAWLSPVLRPGQDGVFEARVSVPPGNYRLLGGSGEGWRFEGTLAVRGHDGAQEALELPLVPPDGR